MYIKNFYAIIVVMVSLSQAHSDARPVKTAYGILGTETTRMYQGAESNCFEYDKYLVEITHNTESTSEAISVYDRGDKKVSCKTQLPANKHLFLTPEQDQYFAGIFSRTLFLGSGTGNQNTFSMVDLVTGARWSLGPRTRVNKNGAITYWMNLDRVT
jgi:hypothetical protein